MLFINVLGLYFLIGLFFSLGFLFWGYQRILSDASGTGFWVRLIWAPAAMTLWPYLLYRWLAQKGGSQPVSK